MFGDGRPSELVSDGITAVALNAGQNYVGFPRGQKRAFCYGAGLTGFIGEVDDSQVANETE